MQGDVDHVKSEIFPRQSGGGIVCRSGASDKKCWTSHLREILLSGRPR